MAEAAAPGNSDSHSRRRFYCHKCSTEITPNNQEFTCPRCNGGFVEELTGSASSRSSSRRSSREAAPSSPEEDVTFESMLNNIVEILDANQHHQSPPRPQQQHQGPPTRRSQRRRHPYVEIRRRDQVEAEAASSSPPVATLRIMRANRVRGVLEHMMHRLGQPATVVGVPMNVMHFHGNPGDYALGPGAMDAIVTQLFNQMDGYGPPPAEGDRIEALPTVTISQDQVESTLQCSVCMDDFIFGESVRQLPCHHHYHSPCIVPWLKLHGTCPVCRKDLNGQDTSSDDPNFPPYPDELRSMFASSSEDDPRT